MHAYPCGCLVADLGGLIRCREHQLREGRNPMPDVKEEFAIQDTATGEWYVQPRRWTVMPGDRPGVDRPAIWYVYADACQGDALRERSSARVVSAPPREMTDAECWAWLRARWGLALSASTDGVHFYVYKPREFHQPYKEFGLFVDPYDAIRAARRSVDGGGR